MFLLFFPSLKQTQGHSLQLFLSLLILSIKNFEIVHLEERLQVVEVEGHKILLQVLLQKKYESKKENFFLENLCEVEEFL